jgi:DNA-binding CsgD family transcriptional regulator
MKRLIAEGVKPKDVAADFQTTDRLVYGYITGSKRPNHKCEHDEAARAMIRKALTPEQKAEIRRLRFEGYSQREIARRIGCTHPAVGNVLREPPPLTLIKNGQSQEAPETPVQPAPKAFTFPANDGSRDWRRVPERDYLIADDGSVWDLRAGAAVTPREIIFGYMEVVLRDPMGEPAVNRVHRLVALIFHGPPPAGCHLVRHCDNDPHNNQRSNLAWATEKENSADRVRAGTTTRSERSKSAKLNDAKVIAIRRERGTPTRLLAAKHGVTESNIIPILAHKTWKHLTDEPTSLTHSASDGERQLRLPL